MWDRPVEAERERGRLSPPRDTDATAKHLFIVLSSNDPLPKVRPQDGTVMGEADIGVTDTAPLNRHHTSAPNALQPCKREGDAADPKGACDQGRGSGDWRFQCGEAHRSPDTAAAAAPPLISISARKDDEVVVTSLTHSGPAFDASPPVKGARKPHGGALKSMRQPNFGAGWSISTSDAVMLSSPRPREVDSEGDSSWTFTPHMAPQTTRLAVNHVFNGSKGLTSAVPPGPTRRDGIECRLVPESADMREVGSSNGEAAQRAMGADAMASICSGRVMGPPEGGDQIRALGKSMSQRSLSSSRQSDQRTDGRDCDDGSSSSPPGAAQLTSPVMDSYARGGKAQNGLTPPPPAAPDPAAHVASQRDSQTDFEMFKPPGGCLGNPRRFSSERDSTLFSSGWKSPPSGHEARSVRGVANASSTTRLRPSIVEHPPPRGDTSRSPGQENLSPSDGDAMCRLSRPHISAFPSASHRIVSLSRHRDRTGRYGTSPSGVTPLLEELHTASDHLRHGFSRHTTEVDDCGSDGTGEESGSVAVLSVPRRNVNVNRYDEAVNNSSVTPGSLQLSHRGIQQASSSISSSNLVRVLCGQGKPKAHVGPPQHEATMSHITPPQVPLTSDSILMSRAAARVSGPKLLSSDQINYPFATSANTDQLCITSQRSRDGLANAGSALENQNSATSNTTKRARVSVDLVRKPIRGTIKAKILGNEPPETEEEEAEQRRYLMERILGAHRGEKSGDTARARAERARQASMASEGVTSSQDEPPSPSQRTSGAAPDRSDRAGGAKAARVTFHEVVTETKYYARHSSEDGMHSTDSTMGSGNVSPAVVWVEQTTTTLNDTRNDGSLANGDVPDSEKTDYLEAIEKRATRAVLRSPPPPASVEGVGVVFDGRESSRALTPPPRADGVPPLPYAPEMLFDRVAPEEEGGDDCGAGASTVAPVSPSDAPLTARTRPTTAVGGVASVIQGQSDATGEDAVRGSCLPVAFTRCVDRSGDSGDITVMETPIVRSAAEVVLASERQAAGTMLPCDLKQSTSTSDGKEAELPANAAVRPHPLASPAVSNTQYPQRRQDAGAVASLVERKATDVSLSPDAVSGGRHTTGSDGRPPIAPVQEVFVKLVVKVTSPFHERHAAPPHDADGAAPATERNPKQESARVVRQCRPSTTTVVTKPRAQSHVDLPHVKGLGPGAATTAISRAPSHAVKTTSARRAPAVLNAAAAPSNVLAESRAQHRTTPPPHVAQLPSTPTPHSSAALFPPVSPHKADAPSQSPAAKQKRHGPLTNRKNADGASRSEGPAHGPSGDTDGTTAESSTPLVAVAPAPQQPRPPKSRGSPMHAPLSTIMPPVSQTARKSLVAPSPTAEGGAAAKQQREGAMQASDDRPTVERANDGYSSGVAALPAIAKSPSK